MMSFAQRTKLETEPERVPGRGSVRILRFRLSSSLFHFLTEEVIRPPYKIIASLPPWAAEDTGARQGSMIFPKPFPDREQS